MSLERVWNRVASLVRVARVVMNPDESGNVQKFQLQYNANETRDKIPSAQFYGFASSPLPGSNVVILNPLGDSGGGVVIASHDPRYRPTGMAPGESKHHDHIGQFVYLAADGSIHITANHKVIIVCDTEVDITAPTIKANASTSMSINTPTLAITCPDVTIEGTLSVRGVIKVTAGEITVNNTAITVP